MCTFYSFCVVVFEENSNALLLNYCVRDPLPQKVLFVSCPHGANNKKLMANENEQSLAVYTTQSIIDPSPSVYARLQLSLLLYPGNRREHCACEPWQAFIAENVPSKY